LRAVIVKMVKVFEKVPHVILISYAEMLANHSTQQWLTTTHTPLQKERLNQRAKISVLKVHFIFKLRQF